MLFYIKAVDLLFKSDTLYLEHSWLVTKLRVNSVVAGAGLLASLSHVKFNVTRGSLIGVEFGAGCVPFGGILILGQIILRRVFTACRRLLLWHFESVIRF